MIKVKGDHDPKIISNSGLKGAKQAESKHFSDGVRKKIIQDGLESQNVAQLKELIRKSPDVDQALVNKIKLEISNNEYKIKPDELARVIVASTIRDDKT